MFYKFRLYFSLYFYHAKFEPFNHNYLDGDLPTILADVETHSLVNARPVKIGTSKVGIFELLYVWHSAPGEDTLFAHSYSQCPDAKPHF